MPPISSFKFLDLFLILLECHSVHACMMAWMSMFKHITPKYSLALVAKHDCVHVLEVQCVVVPRYESWDMGTCKV